MAESLAQMDARLDRGAAWLKAEYQWLTAEQLAGRGDDPAWSERAARYVKQDIRWQALFGEYAARRDAEAAMSPAERQWAALA